MVCLCLRETPSSLLQQHLRASPIQGCWPTMPCHRSRTERDDGLSERCQARRRLLLALAPIVRMIGASASSNTSMFPSYFLSRFSECVARATPADSSAPAA
jgi:hypothetical protein